MHSSFYIHIILYIASILFLLSFLTVLIRLENHLNTHQSNQTFDIHHYHRPQSTFSFTHNVTKHVTKLTNEQLNEISLRKKILGTNLFNHSIFNHFIFINPPKSNFMKLKNVNNSMIIVVLSRTLNFDYRQAIRATWGRKDKYKSSSISIETIFFVGMDDSNALGIQNEQIMFNDLVQIGVPEHQPFLAHKELAVLFWLRLYCPLARILFRIDDDILLDTFLLLNHLEHQINLKNKDGIYGWFRFNKAVLRSGPWAVTKREYKRDTYPPYTLNTAYLFSNESCQRLIDAANHPKQHIVPINDAYITGILRDLAKIPYYTFRNLEYTTSDYNGLLCNTEFASRSRLLICASKLQKGLRGDPYEYYDVWNILLKKYNTSILTLGV